jgi:hypothetical protein
MNNELKARFDPTLVSLLVVYLLAARAAGLNGFVFEIGGDAVVAFDTPRPLAGFRAEGADALAKIAAAN